MTLCVTVLFSLSEDIVSYIEKNVLPYNPLAYLDRSKDKIGYEVPFTRLFYKFVAPTPSDDIFLEIKDFRDVQGYLSRFNFKYEGCS